MAISWKTAVTVLIGAVLFALFRIRGTTIEPRPELPGASPEDSETLIPGGAAWEVSAVTRFMTAATSGYMPDGLQTNQSLFPREYMTYFNSKYVEWAPEPWSKLPNPQTDMGPVLGILRPPGDSPPPIFRIMHTIGEMDRALSMIMSRQKNEIEPSLKAMKSRIWHGLAPVPDALWQAKGLDDMANIEEAMATIQLAIDVFKYWMKPEVHGRIRTTHNRVWTELDVFNDAIVGLRKSREEPEPDFNIAKLWQEYVKNLFQYQENQARSWAFARINKLFSIWKDYYIEKLQSGRVISETKGTILIDHWALMVLNKLLDLYVEAEIFIRRSTKGLALIEGIDRRLIGAITLDKSEEQLNKITAQIENDRQKMLRKVLATTVKTRTKYRKSLPEQFPAFLESSSLMTDREFSMKSLMVEMTEPLPLQPATWVRELSGDNVRLFGFTIYKNIYNVKPDEWDKFVDEFNQAVNSGWEGVLDSDKIRNKVVLNWIDGEGENIPENDVEAVRKHFKDMTEHSDFNSNLTKALCLVVTPSTFESLSKSRVEDGVADDRGFVTVIDLSYNSTQTHNPPPTESDTTTGTGTAEQAAPDRASSIFPEYNGTFNILDQLIWTDLFALHVTSHSIALPEYARLAQQNPSSVYVGPTTWVKRKQWREKLNCGESAPNVPEAND